MTNLLSENLIHTISKTESYRSIFPHTQAHSPHRTNYLNHAAVAPISKRVRDAIQAYLSERSETDIENYFATLMPTLASSRTLVSSFIGCDEKNLAIVSNTSYALNLLAQGLEWKSGDRVLLYEKDFPSNIYPFTNLRAQGVEIDFIPAQSDYEIDLEKIQSYLTSKTKLLSISYVQYITGYRLDLTALAELCHENQVLLSIDAIQGIGAMPIDFNTSNIDFLAAGLHKWGMSPMGTAIAVFSDELLSRLKPNFVGWLSVSDAWNMTNFDQDLKPTAERYELGTYNWIGLIGMNEAFKVFHELGSEMISKKLLHLNRHLSEQLLESGFEPCLRCGYENQSGIISIKNIAEPESVVKALAEARIEISSRAGLLRIAPHYYCSTDDLDELVTALKNHFSKTVNRK